ncbi:MAG TPA: hypothetical protein VGN07_10105 [Steroidobacteraceae bacterium]|jgi:hypothetical protein
MEAALYWSAISLIVCEELPIEQAAKRLGIAEHWLREILYKRQTLPPFAEDSLPFALTQSAVAHSPYAN